MYRAETREVGGVEGAEEMGPEVNFEYAAGEALASEQFVSEGPSDEAQPIVPEAPSLGVGRQSLPMGRISPGGDHRG